MNEIEKMQKHIERTEVNLPGAYSLRTPEAFELAHQARQSGDLPFWAITLAYNYGLAKGYRAAKAEVRA